MLCMTLAGCVSVSPQAPPPTINDSALTVALNSLLCRVEPECAKLRLQVLDRPFEQAEMFPDGRLLVNIGLLLATRDEAEIAFVLAHETAHRRLRHRVAIATSTRTRLELEADADAVRALRQSDLPSDAGLGLLGRLLLQAREAQTKNSDSSDQATTGDLSRANLKRAELEQEALAQIQARVDALRLLVTRSNSAALPVDSDWQRLLAPYRRAADQLKADAPASPPLQNPPDGL